MAAHSRGHEQGWQHCNKVRSDGYEAGRRAINVTTAIVTLLPSSIAGRCRAAARVLGEDGAPRRCFWQGPPSARRDAAAQHRPDGP